jgi:hypothetical protein
MDHFAITLHNFRHVVVRRGRALRFDLTWTYTEDDGLHLSATAEGCMAYVRKGEVDWHYNKTNIRGAYVQTGFPNPGLNDWVRGKLVESGVLKGLIHEDKMTNEARDLMVGEQPPDIKIEENF